MKGMSERTVGTQGAVLFSRLFVFALILIVCITIEKLGIALRPRVCALTSHWLFVHVCVCV